jgi:LysM repeat protein
VEEGETMSDIAQLYGVTVNEILALNPGVDPELINPGQVLLIPAGTQAAGAMGSLQVDGAESTPGDFFVHVVSSGETLSAIAAEYGVSVSAIRAANDLSPDDETIRPEQSLVIPLNTPTPSPTPTPDLDATPTPIPLYGSPPLLTPPDDAVLTGDAPVLLQWASVSVLADDEWYEVSLWQPAGGVVSSTIRTRATAWRAPVDLLEQAEVDEPEFRWRVRVVRESGEQTYEAAGVPSATRDFVWQRSASADRPEATSTP